jgi:hypothetical protein
MQAVEKIIAHYMEALSANKYEIGIIWKQPQHERKIPSHRYDWTAAELISKLNYLKEKNEYKYDIFCRPMDRRYVLLDDITKEGLAKVAEYQPCLLMESSHNNYQLWLKIEDMPENTDHQLMVWRYISDFFVGDPGSAKPKQLGRLPGFINQKPKYQPDQPLVIMHRWANRSSNLSANEILAKPVEEISRRNNPIPRKKTNRVGDRSGFDFAVAVSGLQKGFSDSQIAKYLLEKSEKAQERGDRYIKQTINAAKKATFQF